MTASDLAARSGALTASRVTILLWLLVPLTPLVIWAIATQWSWPGLLPQQLGLRGWRTAADQDLPAALTRSFVIGTATAATAVPLGALAGRALAWRPRRITSLAALVLVLPVAIPPFTIAIGLETMVLRLRLPAVLALVLILAVLALPYTTYVMRAGYAALDPDLERQARTLGAGPMRAFATVTAPALRNPLLATASIAFLVGWSDYIITVVVGGGRLVTVPMLLAAAMSGSGNEPLVAAVALTALAPVVLLAIAVRAGRRPRPVQEPMMVGP